MKIEEVKKRIGLLGLEDSKFTDNLLLIEELGFSINDVGNSDAKKDSLMRHKLCFCNGPMLG